MKKILIAPNSYKECSTSVNASQLFERHLGKSPDMELISVPISDGGDGFIDVCKSNFKLNNLSFEIKRVYSDEMFTLNVGISQDKKSLYIESAKILGLQGIPLNKRKPLSLNSSNLGELLKEINKNRKGVERVIIGIGGTGINDLGLGVCSAFGLKTFDSNGIELSIIPQNYKEIKNIKWSKTNLNFDIELIIDVDNPLFGEYGATKTYSVQKGATLDDIEILEDGFANVLNIINCSELMILPQKLSGAGGGLAAGLQIFFNAKVIESTKFINEFLLGEQLTIIPDFVITGEGFFDNQSLQNKGAKVVIDRFASAGCKVFLVCGKIDHKLLKELGENIIPIELIKYFKNEAESIKYFNKGIHLACNDILTYLAN